MAFLFSLNLNDPTVQNYLERLKAIPAFEYCLTPDQYKQAFSFSKIFKPGDFGHILSVTHERPSMWDVRWGWLPEIFVKSPHFKKEGLACCKAELAAQYERYLSDQMKRCVIIATDYRQWTTVTNEESGESKTVLYKITHAEFPLMLIAGMWGKDEVPGFGGFGFAAFTLPAQECAGKVATRTPLILNPQEAIQYMTGSLQTVHDILNTAIIEYTKLRYEPLIF